MSILQAKITHGTLRLAALGGVMYEEDKAIRLESLAAAQRVAQEMAGLLNMDEAKQEVEVATEVTSDQLKVYWVSVGILAKACEALDHLEDYDYRKNIEAALKIILQL